VQKFDQYNCNTIWRNPSHPHEFRPFAGLTPYKKWKRPFKNSLRERVLAAEVGLALHLLRLDRAWQLLVSFRLPIQMDLSPDVGIGMLLRQNSHRSRVFPGIPGPTVIDELRLDLVRSAGSARFGSICPATPLGIRRWRAFLGIRRGMA
jgi:hypothetical protein